MPALQELGQHKRGGLVCPQHTGKGAGLLRHTETIPVMYVTALAAVVHSAATGQLGRELAALLHLKQVCASTYTHVRKVTIIYLTHSLTKSRQVRETACSTRHLG